MTEVAFHFNLPDKLAYTCRLLRKAHAAGTPAGVTGPADALSQLDADLWRFSALDFIPHCTASAPPDILAHTPIVLAADCAQLPHADLLINIGTEVPAGYERFARLIELVSAHPSDRAQARPRWRHYTESGHAIVQHDLALKE